jgi:hypothetical protein
MTLDITSDAFLTLAFMPLLGFVSFIVLMTLLILLVERS